MAHTYAIADLHGRHDLLMAALHAIRDRDFDAGKPGGVIVFMGDYVDRGPESRQIIETLMAGPEPVFGDNSGVRFVCLQGNHEDIMLQALADPRLLSWWVGNGGGQTLLSYGACEGDTIVSAYATVPPEHIDWLKVLPLTHVDEHRLFVHAGVDPTIPLNAQTAKTMQWMLYPDGFADGHGTRHVVHGHHQFEDGPLLFSGRTDLDTFAWATGRLVVGVFDDDAPGGPVDLIEVIGEPDARFGARAAE